MTGEFEQFIADYLEARAQYDLDGEALSQRFRTRFFLKPRTEATGSFSEARRKESIVSSVRTGPEAAVVATVGDFWGSTLQREYHLRVREGRIVIESIVDKCPICRLHETLDPNCSVCSGTGVFDGIE